MADKPASTVAFRSVTFAVMTAVSENTPKRQTIVTLKGADVPLDVIMASAVSGSSPRVNAQAKWRKADGGIPAKVEMTWTDWFGTPAPIAEYKPMTAPEILAAAKSGGLSPAEIADLLKGLGELAKASK